MQHYSRQSTGDRRNALPAGNIFKTFQGNGMPPMPKDWEFEFSFKTAKDHVDERLTSIGIDRKSIG